MCELITETKSINEDKLPCLKSVEEAHDYHHESYCHENEIRAHPKETNKSRVPYFKSTVTCHTWIATPNIE